MDNVGKQETGKPVNVQVGNNSVNNNRNKDDRHATVEDTADSDDKIIVAVDFLGRVFANILAYPFGFSSSRSNFLPIVTTAYFG